MSDKFETAPSFPLSDEESSTHLGRVIGSALKDANPNLSPTALEKIIQDLAPSLVNFNVVNEFCVGVILNYNPDIFKR